MAFQKLYPQIRPYASGYLSVDEVHTLYWEQSGNPEGVPILMLHGGPGAGASALHRQYFDPEHYRIIIFDQRGSGRSEPLAETNLNSPELMIEDIEMLRKRLKIDRWHIFGGSWGSTLALLYAGHHPDQCISLILRSIFLLSKPEVDWFIYGMKTVFPEIWDNFAKFIPQTERDNLLDAYIEKLNGDDEELAKNAGRAWASYEIACSMLYPHHAGYIHDDQVMHALSLARLESHYFKHFATETSQPIFDLVPNFRKVPATIINGRYDMLTPLKNAYALHKVWPEADFIIVPDGGHSAMDPAMRDQLVKATNNARSIK